MDEFMIPKRVALVLLLAAECAFANPIDAGNVEVELISEVTSIKPGQDFTVGLRQIIEPGWHTYWRNPGDSGAPTTVDWDLPEGFSAGDFEWPAPERIPYGPLLNFGYSDEVLFAVRISVPEQIQGGQVRLVADAHWLVCADICVPEDARLVLTLPVLPDPPLYDVRWQGDFLAARQRVPRRAGLVSDFRFAGDTIHLNVSFPALAGNRIQKVAYFPYGVDVIDNPSLQEYRVDGDTIKLTLTKGYEFKGQPGELDGIIEVVEDAGGLLKTSFEISPALVRAGAASSEVSLVTAVLFAFLGGLILNLMPCVFPVLSIKVLSLMQHVQEDRSKMRTHGFVYLFGVVLSFLAIAGVLIGLRAGGAQIGWGFQLQSPLVVMLLVYLFFVVGLGLSGELNVGSGLMGFGEALINRSGYSGSFFTGVLATLVAAPCTAPFMGAAIGFALTQSIQASVLVFASLGVGMGLPYLILCYSPALLSRLPGPGAWMVTFKEFLAFPMYGSAVWLIWVLSLQAGSDGVLLVLSGLVLISFAIWMLRKISGSSVRRVASALLASLAFLAALVMPAYARVQDNQAGAVSADYKGPAWETFSPALLDEMRAEGPVFVNFTAAWCITCKVNEIVALNSQDVKTAFQAAGLRYLKADWTNEDPVITETLAQYGRSGVPLYLMFPAAVSGEAARILPQILTKNTVLDAIAELK